MSDRPFFSVIVPAYNAADHIKPLMTSIATQTFQDYELIVVCDSCIDDTEEIAKSYGARTIPVQYHLDGLTRNKGIDEARGQWLLFADDDDWFLHEYAFEQLADMAGKHDEDAVLFSHIDRERGYMRHSPDNIHVPVWSKCWRREFIGDTRFPYRHYWSDCDFHNKIMRKPHKFVYWDMPLYYYNFMRKGSITQKVLDGEMNSFGYNKPAHVILREKDVK